MATQPEHDSSSTEVSLRVELVLLTVRDGRLAVLLIKDMADRSMGHWALPGGPIQPEEDLDGSAHRLLSESTGLDNEPWHIEQLRSYLGALSTDSNPTDSDPVNSDLAGSRRSASVAYMAFMPLGKEPAAGSTAEAYRWWAVDDLWDDGPILKGEHVTMISDAVERCRSKLEYTTVAASFLAEPFTLGELRRVYENVWSVKLHHSNFARKLTSSPGYLVAEVDGSPGRATLYRRGDANYVMPPILRPGTGSTEGTGD